MRSLLAGVATAACCIILVAVAQAGALDQAERLFRQGAYAEARASASSATAETPAEGLRREWLLAQAHLREGAPRSALPHLERLVSDAPEQTRFRLELARALFLIEDDTRARLHFERALAGRMSIGELHAVHEYLAAMDRRKSWEGYLRAAMAPQSNAWRRSGLESVVIGGILEMPLEQVERSTGLEVEFGGSWLPVIDRDLRARLHASLRAQLYDESQHNTLRLRTEAGLVALRDRGVQFGGGLSGRLHTAARDRVLQGYGVYATWQGRTGRATLVSLRGDAELLRYPRAAALDGARYQLSGRVQHAVSPQLGVQFGAELSHQHTRVVFQRNTQLVLSMGAEYAFPGGVVGGTELSLSQTRYAGEHPFFIGLGARQDTRMALSGQLMHRDWQLGGFVPIVEMGYERQTSSIPIYGFDNMRVSLGMSRRF